MIATQLRTLDAIAGLPAWLSVCGRAGMVMAAGAVAAGRGAVHVRQTGVVTSFRGANGGAAGEGGELGEQGGQGGGAERGAGSVAVGDSGGGGGGAARGRPRRGGCARRCWTRALASPTTRVTAPMGRV